MIDVTVFSLEAGVFVLYCSFTVVLDVGLGCSYVVYSKQLVLSTESDKSEIIWN